MPRASRHRCTSCDVWLGVLAQCDPPFCSRDIFLRRRVLTRHSPLVVCMPCNSAVRALRASAHANHIQSESHSVPPHCACLQDGSCSNRVLPRQPSARRRRLLTSSDSTPRASCRWKSAALLGLPATPVRILHVHAHKAERTTDMHTHLPRSESVLYNRSVDGGSSGAIWKRAREPLMLASCRHFVFRTCSVCELAVEPHTVTPLHSHTSTVLNQSGLGSTALQVSVAAVKAGHVTQAEYETILGLYKSSTQGIDPCSLGRV